MCLTQGPQRSDAGEARTRSPSVSRQALFNWATALPKPIQVNGKSAHVCLEDSTDFNLKTWVH